MEIWAPVLVTLAINAFGIAFFYGVSWQKIKGHSDSIKWIMERLERADDDSREQWTAYTRNREDIAKIKGKLGMNGHH